MVGNVRLERGGSFLNGGRLTIDLDTGRAVMDGGLRGVNQPGGGRVTGRFTVPQAQQPANERGRALRQPARRAGDDGARARSALDRQEL